MKELKEKDGLRQQEVLLSGSVKLLDHGQRPWTQFESFFAAVSVTPVSAVFSKGIGDWKSEELEYMALFQ